MEIQGYRVNWDEHSPEMYPIEDYRSHPPQFGDEVMALVAIADVQPELDRLRAEVEALREDAERYRWLRETSANGWSNGDDYEPVLVFVTTADSKSWREELDAAIDAAREDA